MRNKVVKHGSGYNLVFLPSHPACQKSGHVYEHRYVMEEHIGRYLSSIEQVHHINGVKDDNRIKNLFLCKDGREHRLVHNGWVKKKETWFKRCSKCHKELEASADNWYFRKTGKISYYCIQCEKAVSTTNGKTQKYKDRKNELRREKYAKIKKTGGKRYLDILKKEKEKRDAKKKKSLS